MENNDSINNEKQNNEEQNKNNQQDNNGKQSKIDYKEIFSWVKYIGSAILIALFLTNFVIINAYIPSGSMENTIMTKDRVIASRLHYLFSEPERGDIIVFKFPDDEKTNFVKRVIGLPGETVEIKEGIVYIDGVKLEEPYLKETPRVEDNGPYVVPEDSYFMLGDNRNDSADSRAWRTTNYVHKSKILGKVAFKYFPGFKWLW